MFPSVFAPVSLICVPTLWLANFNLISGKLWLSNESFEYFVLNFRALLCRRAVSKTNVTVLVVIVYSKFGSQQYSLGW